MSYKALTLMATLSLLLGASSTESTLGPHPITFETEDGILIHGWYIHTGAHDVVHAEDESFFAQYSAVVLLHAYRGSKEDWGPIIREFFDREVAALAIDMRGHGDSTVGIDGEDLSIRVRDRDEPLFNSMWQDATAAVDWLVSKGHRKDRIAILGASVGCSVAIDAARRDPELRVVGVLARFRMDVLQIVQAEVEVHHVEPSALQVQPASDMVLAVIRPGAVLGPLPVARHGARHRGLSGEHLAHEGRVADRDGVPQDQDPQVRGRLGRRNRWQ